MCWRLVIVGFLASLNGLDQFGRILDLTYAGSRPEPLVQVGYGYDSRGNRTFARITGGAEGQSWRYWYDSLNRLIGAARGTLNAAGDSFIGDTDPETIGWSLDDLGNWSSDGVGKAGLQRFTDVGGDGIFDDATDTLHSWQRHNTNEVNEIESVTAGDAAGTNGVEPFAYDDAGNLILDHEHYYVYDAWNRLVKIHEPGTLAVGTNGVLCGMPGAVVADYEYDALGRRVRTLDCGAGILLTHPEGKSTSHVYGGGPEVLAEYDATTSGVETLERWFVHGQSFPNPIAMVDLTDAGDVEAGQEERLYYLKDALGSVMALADDAGQVVERYVYTPYGRTTVLSSDGAEALPPLGTSYYYDADLDGDVDDEDLDHIIDCMRSRDPMCLFAHDRNGDGRVMSNDLSVFFICYSTNGEAPGPECLRPRQPYFDVNGDESIDLWDIYGFQACFGSNGPLCTFVYDIDDDGAVDLDDFAALQSALGGPGIPRPIQDAGSRYGNPFMWTGQRYESITGLYHFHARSYSPELGRFLQKDPIGVLDSTGEPYFGEPGSAPFIGSPLVAAVSEYLNSFNLYLYVNSSPINGTDPMGRYDEYDELIDDLTGHKIAALGYIVEGAAILRRFTEGFLDIAGSLLGIDVFQSAMVIAEGQGGFWDTMNIAMAVNPFGRVATIGAKAVKWGRAFAKTRKAAKAAKAVIHAHHPLPKFLGGKVKQILSKLDPNIHTEYHSVLRARLRERELPLNVGGVGGSSKDWADYFTRNPGTQDKAFNAVLDASREIDMRYGTSITQDVWRNIMAGNFTSFP